MIDRNLPYRFLRGQPLKIEFTLMLLRTRDKSINRNELRRFILNNSGADILGNIN